MAKITKKSSVIVSILVIALVLFLIYFPAYPLLQATGLSVTSGIYDPKLFIWLTILAISTILTLLKILALDTNFKYFMVLIVLALMIFIEGLLLIIFTHTFDFMFMKISISRFCESYTQWMLTRDANNSLKFCTDLSRYFPGLIPK